MPSKIIDAYRQALAQQGVTDDRPDDFVIRELGPIIQQEAPQIFDQDPELGQLWSEVRDADAPSLPAEASRAFKGGLQGLASTALGGTALLTGSSYLRDKAASFDQDAAVNAPTIGTLEEIAPGRRGINKALSRDALRYAISKIGQVAPSIGESVLTGAAGALIGSEVAPGPGTIVGAGVGVLEKGLIKSAIRRLLAKGVAEELATKGLIAEASEVGLQQALRKGVPAVAEAVSAEAKAVGALRGGIAANAAGSFLLNSGDVASEGADRATSLALGAVSALPDTILPAYVLSKLFPGMGKKAAVEAGKSFLARNATKIGELAGIPPAEFAQEYFQESINVVARNLKDGKDPLTFTDADLRRLREAGIAGAAGGLLAAPGVALSGRDGEAVPDRAADPATSVPPPPAFVPPARAAAQIIREVGLMTPEQKAARAAELASLPSRTSDQEKEFQLLSAGTINQPPTTAELNATPAIAVPVSPPASAPIEAAPASGLAMLGRRVSYEGKTGVLRRMDDGTLAVDTPTQLVEILGVTKDQDFDPAASGISLYRPVSVEGTGVKVGDETFSLPDNPGDALNFDPSGALTSITLTNGDGQTRTIRDPEIAYEVAEKLAMRHHEQSRAADIKPPTAVELAGQTPEALWIDGWTKGFLPQTVDVSDLLDLGDSVMPDGSNVSARGEYWQMARPLEQRTIQTARTNIESQISRVEKSSLGQETKTDLTNELYDLLDRLERFEKERSVRTPTPAPQAFPESVAPGGAPAGASETQAAAPPVEAVTAQPNERARYDEIQQQLAGMVEQVGTPAYNALQQESEDIKNRNAGMPPGEVAAEAAALNAQLGTPAPTSAIPSVEENARLDALTGAHEPLIAKMSTEELDNLGKRLGTKRNGTTDSAFRVRIVTNNHPDDLNAALGLEVAPPAETRALEAALAMPAVTPEAVIEKPATEPTPAGVFDQGAVVEGAPSLDFRVAPEFQNLTPEQWAQVLTQSLDAGPRSDKSGNRSLTRVGVAMQGPDGRVVVSGLTVPQKTLTAAGTTAISEPALQRMGVGRAGRRAVEAGGNHPATVRDAIAAGFKPLAVLHFAGEPSKIFQTFADEAAFDAAWGATEKTQGRQIRAPQMTAQPAIARNREADITRKIDDLGNQLLRAKTQEERTRLTNELKVLFTELDRATRNEQAQTGEVPLDDAPQLRSARQQQVQGADQSSVFQNVMANMKNLGMRVDLFAKEIFLQSAREPILEQIQQLQAALATAQGSQRTAIEQRIAQRQARLTELDQAAGVTYSPYHIAISMDDVQKADLGNVVTLLHEAAESLTMRLGPVAKGEVLRALDQALVELRQQAAEASQQTGVPVSTTTSATDLLAETMAQKLAANGVADPQSLAQAIVRWIKDLYYRTAMAVQRGFGIEPDPQMAIDWFENQLRREVGGDFDYRLSNLMSGFQRVPMVERAANFTGQKDTPGGVADFLDPFGQTIQQPWVEPISSEAMRWNVEFRQSDAPVDQNIPDPEARARIDSASVAEIATMVENMHQEIARDMPWVDFWKLVGRGEDPKVLLAEQGARVPGSEQARIGGERMTKTMNDLASLNARILAEKIHLRQIRELAKSKDAIASAAESMIEESKEINRIEGDMRNAALHEDTLRVKLRELAKSLVRNMRRGYEAAHTSGQLAEAIRNAEGLMETDPIPEAYQRVLKAATEGSITLFDSVRALAELDLPLADMSNAEIVRAIRDNAEMSPQLQALANNKPLSVAIAELGRRNIEQLDQIQLGWLRDTTKFREIHQQLDQIRGASSEEVAQMIRQMDERTKAKGLAERLKVGYLKRRRALQTQQTRIQKAEARVAVLEKAIPLTAVRVNEMQASGGGAYSEWYPVEGAKFTAMVPGAGDAYTSERRELKFNPDGSAQDSDQLKRDVANNLEWLRANQERKGTRHFESVKRQTLELAMLDIQRKYPAGWVNALERMVQPIGAEARAAGHSAGARIAQMLQQFEFINRSHRDEVSAASGWWTRAFTDIENSTGIKDHGQLLSQVYDPVMYFLNVNPGLDETHAIREATRLARKLLPKPPADNFNERFATFLRRTKESSELMLKIAEQYGVYVKDPRISGALRSAVAQGWLTTPRGLRADVIQTIVRDMQAAGWKLQLKETTAPDGTPRRSVVRATTFDSLTAEDLDPQNSAALSGALKKFFTPGIIDRWLVPFINKPGTEIFSNDGNPIPQLQVQQAWQASGGDVLRFIDNLAGGMDMEVDEESGINPLAEFRGQILRQIDSLFSMEAKLAHESEQVRDLFDPMGPKPHAMMDARMNDLLPPEHVQFQSFDPTSSQRLLGMLAFHGAFGRNGERMVQTINELKGVMSARKAEFDSLKGTTKGARAAEAAVRGLDYKQLEAAADRYAGVLSMQDKIRGLFGVGNSAGPFHDLRGGMEVMNAMAGQIVDQPKVGAYNLLSIAMRPFAMRSLGPMTISASVRGYANFLTTAMGSFLENLNVHVMHSSDYAKEVGSVEGQIFRNLPWGTVLADIGQRGRFQTSKTDRFMIRPLRALRAVQRKGVKVGVGDGIREFPRLAMIPGLGVLNSMSQIAAQANTMAQVQMVENIVRKGISYFNNHPTDLHDPTFRFTAAKLGIGRLDTGVFDYLRIKTVEYGMGNMEDMVRAAVPAAAKGERLLTRDQVLRLAQMAANELDGASSINTTPAILQTNPILKIGMPLLRWPLWMMHTVNEGLNTVDGQRSLLAMAKGLGTLALWNLPMGIAFSLLLDQYDDKILHKKANQRPIDALAAIPIVGPGLALTVGERGWDNAMAMLERGARAGNIYGLGADVAAQMLAPYDPNSGQRSFSMDQRILVMSQFLNFQQAVRNLISQGGSATWASFWRPAMLSIGGNGVLHSIDITNNLMGLDNAESRLVQRIHAQNWLRAAGRETGLELRPGGASTGTAPTPMSVWTREMSSSAMANDRLGFLESYRKALNAAREQVGSDPRVSPVDREKEAASRVLSSWASRSPLEVFRFKPTTIQLSELYSTMDDDGRHDVQEAIRRFESFSQLIKPSGVDRFINRSVTQGSRMQGMNALRNSGASLIFSGSR